MTKNKIYCTSTVLSNSCMLPKDYSYATNAKCLECKFCYKLTHDQKERLHLSKYIEEESRYSENLYLAPILISRYCEPFLNPTYIKHSLFVAQKMIDNGSQVIFRTDGSNLHNDEIITFLKSNNKNVQVQLRVFNDHSTLSGKYIKDTLCPNMALLSNGTIYDILILKKHGVDITLLIDPYIIGVNDIDIKRLVESFNNLGIKKVIIKQLFATEYFTNYLSTMIDRKFTSLLKCQVGRYKTYDTLDLLESLAPLFEFACPRMIDISFCMNKELNEIIGMKYNNCCMFENACGVYDLSQNLQYRNKGYKITKPEREFNVTI